MEGHRIKPDSGRSFLPKASRKTADFFFAAEQESICGNRSEPVREVQHCVTKYVIVLRQQAAALYTYVFHIWDILFDTTRSHADYRTFWIMNMQSCAWDTVDDFIIVLTVKEKGYVSRIFYS
jgi:hypothetical protein